MSQAANPSADPSNDTATDSVSFVDRRNLGTSSSAGCDRRQFNNTHDDLSPQARELAIAIDQYKLLHRRRFITYEEMLDVITTLGYQK